MYTAQTYNTGLYIMNTHHHSVVNALTNPVTMDDIILSETGERYIVKQSLKGDYWLQHAASGIDLTYPVSGQINIVSQIADLVNI
jgi:hypothetical protein